MKFRKKRSILIKRKHLRIIIPVVLIVAVVVVIVLVTSANKDTGERQQTIDEAAAAGIINIGLRGDLGALCSLNAETGEFEGLEKDVVDEIISRLLGDEILVNYVLVNSETKDALLRLGEIDIALGASLRKDVDGLVYSESYYADGSAFLVIDGEMTGEAGLKGRRIGIVQGSLAAEDSETKDLNRMEAYLKAHDINADVQIFASYPEAVDALETGHIGGMCAGEIFLKQHGKKGMLILPERFMPHRFRVETGTPLEKFCGVISQTLREMDEDGTLKRLYEKWNLIDYSALEE